MRSCDTCPGGSDCAAVNLHPILLKVHACYANGMTDKFDILFSLGEESEALLEKYDTQVSRPCWTKAALLALADIIVEQQDQDIAQLLSSGIKAFERFPWQIPELIEQAPELYQAIIERDPDGPFAADNTKRGFIKICKAVAFE